MLPLHEFSVSKNGVVKSWCKSCMRVAIKASQAKRRVLMRQRVEVDLPELKKCTRCKLEKPNVFFGRSKQNPDGLRWYCKECDCLWAQEKYSKNIDQMRERGRIQAVEYYHKNRERSLERARVNSANRKARELMAEGKHTRLDILEILARQKSKCAFCKINVKKNFHVDHIEPISKGGSNWPWNLQVLCPPCNMSKHDNDPFVYAQKNGRLL